MSGLYHKALQYIQAQRQLRIVRPDEMTEEEVLDVSPDDREKILSQINEIVDKNRIVIEPDTFDFQPKRRGGVLPLLFNLAALLIIAVGGFLLITFFDRSEESIVTNRTDIQSAEGKLLAALKEESEQQLVEKERAIADIQTRLEEMNAEREQIEANAEAKIRERENELQAALTEQLAAERARLTGEGLAENDIAARLADFEIKQQTLFDQELLAVRAEAQKEIDLQRETLNTLTLEYEQALGVAEQEKSVLQEEWTIQEATLLADFQRKEAVLESERLDALQELESLRSLQEREGLVLDQIHSFYDSVRVHLTGGSLDAAIRSLGELETYINQTDVASLRRVSERREVELFLIGSLKDLIGEQQRAESPDTQSLIRSAEMLSAASILIEQGNERYAARDYEAANELYISAFAGIPAIEVGYKRIKEIEAGIAGGQAGEVSIAIGRANEAYLSGELGQAVALYGEALDLMSPGTGDQITGQLTQAGFNLNREEDLSVIRDLRSLISSQSADLETLRALRSELEGEISTLETRTDDDAETIEEIPALRSEMARLISKTEEDARVLLTLRSRETSRIELKNNLDLQKNRYLSYGPDSAGELSVLDLLETKLVLRRIVSAEPVKSQYPNLYDNIEIYIDSLIRNRQAEARLSTLQTINQLLDSLFADDGSIGGDPPVQFQGTGEQDAFLALIIRLTKLLE